MSWTSCNKRYNRSTANYEIVDKVKKKLFMACKETENFEEGDKILTADCAENVIVCSNGNGHALNCEEEGKQTLTEKRAIISSPEAKQVTEITQKFSEPGHGNVQEIDAVHSLIERNLRHQEIFRPLSLMRAFLKIKSKALTFKFLQMVDDDFHCYHEEAVKYGFNQIPFSKVKAITYNKYKWNILQYKTSFQGPTTSVDINKNIFIS
ncbi:unnamed protein product [Parnassius apollo]|uniref:(apollo) hypothetical protein n=1 Tax=Parnassius apollo TaxID=110799 RepID=A0A8S3XJP4_PARAO|nr:unnamed protein product [Parnassius apollo]